jgi:DNA-binding sugar fermentation-stimulating protein
VFGVQRCDSSVFRPTDEIDAEYGRWLRRVIKAGVEALPYPVRMTLEKIIQTQRLVVKL